MRRIVAALLLTLGAAPAGFAIEPDGFMSDEEISTLVSGRTFDGEFVGGVAWREAYHADGTLDYEARGSRWVGDWHVSGEMFCTFYRGATDGGCYYVRQVSDNCYHFFIAGFGIDEQHLDRSAENRTEWYARGYRTQSPSTCPGTGVS